MRNNRSFFVRAFSRDWETSLTSTEVKRNKVSRGILNNVVHFYLEIVHNFLELSMKEIPSKHTKKKISRTKIKLKIEIWNIQSRYY